MESLVYSALAEPLGVTHYLAVKAEEAGGVSMELCLSPQQLFPSASTANFLPSATMCTSKFDPFVL